MRCVKGSNGAWDMALGPSTHFLFLPSLGLSPHAQHEALPMFGSGISPYLEHAVLLTLPGIPGKQQN